MKLSRGSFIQAQINHHCYAVCRTVVTWSSSIFQLCRSIMVKHLVELPIAKSDIAFLRVLSKNSEFICPTLITKVTYFFLNVSVFSAILSLYISNSGSGKIVMSRTWPKDYSKAHSILGSSEFLLREHLSIKALFFGQSSFRSNRRQSLKQVRRYWSK